MVPNAAFFPRAKPHSIKKDSVTARFHSAQSTNWGIIVGMVESRCAWCPASPSRQGEGEESPKGGSSLSFPGLGKSRLRAGSKFRRGQAACRQLAGQGPFETIQRRLVRRLHSLLEQLVRRFGKGGDGTRYAESDVHEEAGGTTSFVIGSCTDALIRVTTTSAGGSLSSRMPRSKPA